MSCGWSQSLYGLLRHGIHPPVAFTYERDLDHPITEEVERFIRDVLKVFLCSPELSSLEGFLMVFPSVQELRHEADCGPIFC